MTKPGPSVTLAAVTYRTTYGDEAGVTIRDVAYLGVIARKSDGFTTLSVRKPGSTKAFNIETGKVVAITAHGQQWKPRADPTRWALRAAEMRSFVEQVDLEDWAKPYFDPAHEKYHGGRRRSEHPVPAERRFSDCVSREAPQANARPLPRPSLIRQMVRRIFGGG